MATVTAVEQRWHGHTMLTLNDGLSVALHRGDEIPKVGDEWPKVDLTPAEQIEELELSPVQTIEAPSAVEKGNIGRSEDVGKSPSSEEVSAEKSSRGIAGEEKVSPEKFGEIAAT